jgi:uncharacterized protein YutE (UPF0331/DUF86 family)
MKSGHRFWRKLRRGGAFLLDDVSLNKAQIIERCIRRIEEEYGGDPANLSNITRQDSIILNLLRACEAAIALAMHWVSEKGWGVPNTSREAFDFLVEHGAIEASLANRLKAMLGFRNIAVHDYQKMNLDILHEIIAKHLGDLTELTRTLMHMNS